MTSSFDISRDVKHPCHMAGFRNEQGHEADRHRRRRPLWTVLLLVLTAALIVNAVAIDASQIGFLVPVFVAVAIAISSEDRGNACGRRHAK